jgi:hypothetical protein
VSGSLRETLLLAIPSFFDLVATVLMNVGLLSVTASVYQMMRGAEMLFAAAMAVTFLKRHLNKYHGLGLLCCTVRAWDAVVWRVCCTSGVAAGAAAACLSPHTPAVLTSTSHVPAQHPPTPTTTTGRHRHGWPLVHHVW